MIRDKFIGWPFGVSLGLIVVSAIAASLSLPLGRGDVIIRFDNYHNEVLWSGGVSTFFLVIGVAALVVAVNFLLARHVYEKERFLSYILAAGTLIVSVLFLIAVFTTSFVN